MKRAWLRWTLMSVFVIALGVTFVNLGQWQLDRLDQRRDSNATVVEHEAAPIQPFEDVFTRQITDEDQWQRVQVRGTFLADRQLQARYRSFDGRTGWELVTPLETTTGQVVLVDRGFIERPPGQDFPRTFPAPPAGEVEVIGYVRRNEQGKDNQMTPTENTVRLINSDALSPWVGRPLVNGFIAAIEVQPGQSAELEPVTPPPLTEGPHLSYALQWFAFTAIAAIGLIVLIRNDIRDRKRAAERAERAAAAGPAPQPTAEEATHGSRTD
ncbi:MAG: SURF1 family protein [Propionibacteriaceae bacterium]|nr:SURF1 family protein [Propionibacteriaceae bacterium]